MTKALRITSIAVAAAAVLLVALPVVFSSGMDEQTASLLGSPGVLESLNKSAVAADTGAVSPLVQQAEKFAAYLNPPPTPKREKPVPARNNHTPIRPTQPVTAKFELLGTSYYPDRPELSLALIDEPGSGLRWIRQSSKIGHLIVEQVMDGKVTIRDGTNTYELEPKRTPKRSLVKGESSYSAKTPSSGLLYTELPESRADAPPSPREAINSSRSRPPLTRTNTRINKGRSVPAAPPSNIGDSELSDKQAALFDQFAREVNDINDPNEWMERADKLMERLAEASQVTNEEAELLDELGEKLKDANEQQAPED
jgi:hypothetical protein